MKMSGKAPDTSALPGTAKLSRRREVSSTPLDTSVPSGTKKAIRCQVNHPEMGFGSTHNGSGGETHQAVGLSTRELGAALPDEHQVLKIGPKNG